MDTFLKVFDFVRVQQLKFRLLAYVEFNNT